MSILYDCFAFFMFISTNGFNHINQIGFLIPVPPVSTSNPRPGHHLGLAATTAFPATTQRESSAQTASGEPPGGVVSTAPRCVPLGFCLRTTILCHQLFTLISFMNYDTMIHHAIKTTMNHLSSCVKHLSETW